MDNYDNSYGSEVNYGEEYDANYGEGEDAVGGGTGSSSSSSSSSSSTGSVGGGSVSVGGGSVSVGGGSVSVSGSAGAGSIATGGLEEDFPDLDGFKEESITDLNKVDLEDIYKDYNEYYEGGEDKVLPAKTDDYQVESLPLISLTHN